MSKAERMELIELDENDRLNFLSHACGFYFSACAAINKSKEIFEFDGSMEWTELERSKQSEFNGLGAAGLTNGAFAIETCLKGLLTYSSQNLEAGRKYGDYTHDLKRLFSKVEMDTPSLANIVRKYHNSIHCGHRKNLLDELDVINDYFVDARYSHIQELRNGSWPMVKHVYNASEQALRSLLN